jgi:SNF2 family DNA or RNA helicase
MRLDARDKAIQEFRNAKGACVLIASIRCGGVGLNLTMAQRVIIVDPWWNWAVEEQAYCRVYRIGQTEKTSLTRIYVRDTVDGKMFKMQKNKSAKIDAIMDPKGSKDKDLPIEELLKLFGTVSHDEDGNFIIDKERPKKAPIFDDVP